MRSRIVMTCRDRILMWIRDWVVMRMDVMTCRDRRSEIRRMRWRRNDRSDVRMCDVRMCDVMTCRDRSVLNDVRMCDVMTCRDQHLVVVVDHRLHRDRDRSDHHHRDRVVMNVSIVVSSLVLMSQ